MLEFIPPPKKILSTYVVTGTSSGMVTSGYSDGLVKVKIKKKKKQKSCTLPVNHHLAQDWTWKTNNEFCKQKTY